ncbi:MAG: 50S ribosomal protein L10 [Candidatus Omnitrophica bacterium]|nr:50S ribosomal protein L10 [Candidatus Omnitrophota bacterium]MBU1853572.1 50S ribosomal protein L10 [Candidatus Omnitrophota bacterium]
MAKRSKECKKIMVEEMATRLNTRGMFIITNFKGLSSQDLNDLRKQLRDVSSEYLVIKDLIAKRAISEGPNSMIGQFIEGEVGIAIYQKDDSTYISKILAKFSKEHERLSIRGGAMDGAVLSKEDISRLASLPSKEVLLGQLANVLNAPIQGLAGALSAILCKILYALNAVKDKKEKTDEGKRPEEVPSSSKDEVEEKNEDKAEPEQKEEPKIEEEKKESKEEDKKES